MNIIYAYVHYMYILYTYYNVHMHIYVHKHIWFSMDELTRGSRCTIVTAGRVNSGITVKGLTSLKLKPNRRVYNRYFFSICMYVVINTYHFLWHFRV